MPRDLTVSRHELPLQDNITGEKFSMFYRVPENPERIKFSSSLFVKKGKKTIYKENVFKEQVEFGKSICLGFSEGYFKADGLFISSDPAQPYYRPDWKDLVEKGLPEAFQEIAIKVTRPLKVLDQDEAMEAIDSDEIEAAEPAQEESAAEAEAAPLASSSEDSSSSAPQQTGGSA